MKSRQEVKEATIKPKNLVYGLDGIKQLFGCSTTTVWRIKNSEWIHPAISQVGRNIVVDADHPNVTVNHNYIFYVLFREINYLYKYILVLYTLLAMIGTLLNFAA